MRLENRVLSDGNCCIRVVWIQLLNKLVEHPSGLRHVNAESAQSTYASMPPKPEVPDSYSFISLTFISTPSESTLERRSLQKLKDIIRLQAVLVKHLCC